MSEALISRSFCQLMARSMPLKSVNDNETLVPRGGKEKKRNEEEEQEGDEEEKKKDLIPYVAVYDLSLKNP